MFLHELLERKQLKPQRKTVFFFGVNRGNSVSATC